MQSPLSKLTVKLSTRLFIFKQRSNELPKETPSSEGSERQCDDEICLTNHPDYPLTMIQQGLTRHGTLDDKKAFSSLVSLILIVEHWKSEPTRASCVRLPVSTVRTELRQLDGEHQAAAVVRPEGEPALQGLPEVHLPAEGAHRARRVQVHTRSRNRSTSPFFILGSDMQ